MARCKLYQVKYLSDRGYVVYRQSFEALRCTLEEWVKVHRTADFITEGEASEYAEHRNLLVDKHGSDKLPEVA